MNIATPTAAAEIVLTPSHETGRIDNGDLSYNIQMARDTAGVWFQRHIWFRGPHIKATTTEPWIAARRTGPDAHMKAVAA